MGKSLGCVVDDVRIAIERGFGDVMLVWILQR